MVDVVIALGDFAGILASAGFVYWELGRYAEPQVKRSLFNERKLFIAYTAGLFVGIALLVLYVLLEASLYAGGVLGGLILLVALVGVVELAQWLVGRSVYFGTEAPLPFYVLGYRAGAAGLLGLGVVAAYFQAGALSVLGVAGALAEAVAFVTLLAAAGIQSTPTGPRDARRPGSVGRSAILELFGFLLLVVGPLAGPAGPLVAALAVSGGSAGIFLRRRDDVLGGIRPPRSEDPADEAPATGRFGRQDRN